MTPTCGNSGSRWEATPKPLGLACLEHLTWPRKPQPAGLSLDWSLALALTGFSLFCSRPFCLSPSPTCMKSEVPGALSQTEGQVNYHIPGVSAAMPGCHALSLNCLFFPASMLGSHAETPGQLGVPSYFRSDKALP